MLLTLDPLAGVLAAISPSVSAISVPQVILEVADVTIPARPMHRPMPVHRIFTPESVVHSPVGPLEDAPALDVVHFEHSFVEGPVGKYHFPMAVLASHKVVSLIRRPILPCLLTSTMLLVIMPIANVSGASKVSIRALALRTVLHPSALIFVAVRVVHHAKTVRLVVDPCADELAPVAPLHGTLAVPHASIPLAQVDARCQSDWVCLIEGESLQRHNTTNSVRVQTADYTPIEDAVAGILAENAALWGTDRRVTDGLRFDGLRPELDIADDLAFFVSLLW